jgi:hypothetical protein
MDKFKRLWENLKVKGQESMGNIRLLLRWIAMRHQASAQAGKEQGK